MVAASTIIHSLFPRVACTLDIPTPRGARAIGLRAVGHRWATSLTEWTPPWRLPSLTFSIVLRYRISKCLPDSTCMTRTDSVWTRPGPVGLWPFSDPFQQLAVVMSRIKLTLHLLSHWMFVVPRTPGRSGSLLFLVSFFIFMFLVVFSLLPAILVFSLSFLFPLLCCFSFLCFLSLSFLYSPFPFSFSCPFFSF